MDRPNTEFWKKKLVVCYPVLEKSVKRRFKNEVEKSNEALSFVSEKLVEDDMRRLRLYDPARGATFETYFSVLVQRLISSFIEKNRKRRRFPKWIEKQKNFLWQMVYKLLCWESKSETDVVEYFKISAPGERDASILYEAISVIRETYPDCGHEETAMLHMEDENAYPGETLHNDTSFHHLSPEDQVALRQVISVADAIYSEPDTSSEKSGHGELSTVKAKLREEFQPSPEKRLFLRMIYQDGMSVSHAGRMLGWNANQAAGHHRRLLEQLKEILGDIFYI